MENYSHEWGYEIFAKFLTYHGYSYNKFQRGYTTDKNIFPVTVSS